MAESNSFYLTINAGSSSIKFCLFDSDSLTKTISGSISGIGFISTEFKVKKLAENNTSSYKVEAPEHKTAAEIIYKWIQEHLQQNTIVAIGHRIVHGGPEFSASRLISPEVIKDLHVITSLNPEHLPYQIESIELTGRNFPKVKQVACFDTAFFHELPTNAKLLPLPRKYSELGLRRYGFHGLSYTYLLEEFEQVAGKSSARGKIVMAHLGNGASLAAVKDCQPIDTSMGLTPAGGIPMSTRSGDLDPGIITYLAAHEHLTTDQINHVIGFESGLLGISETTSDMKKLLEIETDDPRAKDAVDIFCYQAKKYIGAYAAAMGGIDSLIFSGGIGEAAPKIRARICDQLDFLGISIDQSRNQMNTEVISSGGSKVGVYVMATDEATTIVREISKIDKEQN